MFWISFGKIEYSASLIIALLNIDEPFILLTLSFEYSLKLNKINSSISVSLYSFIFVLFIYSMLFSENSINLAFFNK